MHIFKPFANDPWLRSHFLFENHLIAATPALCLPPTGHQQTQVIPDPVSTFRQSDAATGSYPSQQRCATWVFHPQCRTSSHVIASATRRLTRRITWCGILPHSGRQRTSATAWSATGVSFLGSEPAS